MSQQSGPTTLNLRNLLELLNKLRNREGGEYIELILNRLKKALLCLKRGQDYTGAKCSKSSLGEYFLKTWRISREPKILESIRKNIPEHIQDFNSLGEFLRVTSTSLLDDKYSFFIDLEKKTPRIVAFLKNSSWMFELTAGRETEPEMKTNLRLLFLSFKEMAHLVYHGEDYNNKLIPYSDIVIRTSELLDQIKDISWPEKLSPGLEESADSLMEVCREFGVVLSPFIPASWDMRQIDFEDEIWERMETGEAEMEEFSEEEPAEKEEKTKEAAVEPETVREETPPVEPPPEPPQAVKPPEEETEENPVVEDKPEKVEPAVEKPPEAAAEAPVEEPVPPPQKQEEHPALKAKKLLVLFHGLKSNDQSGYVDLALGRLKKALISLKTGKDVTGARCTPITLGEYLLKTWRITREPDALNAIKKHLPDHQEEFMALAEFIRVTAENLLSDRYSYYRDVEEKTTEIVEYLETTSDIFGDLASRESDPRQRDNLRVLFLSFKELSYIIDRGEDFNKKLISFSEISNRARELWNKIKEVNWIEELSPGLSKRAMSLHRVCERFITLLSPFIPATWDLKDADVAVETTLLPDIPQAHEKEEMVKPEPVAAREEPAPPEAEEAEEIEMPPEIIVEEEEPQPEAQPAVEEEIREEPEFLEIDSLKEEHGEAEVIIEIPEMPEEEEQPTRKGRKKKSKAKKKAPAKGKKIIRASEAEKRRFKTPEAAWMEAMMGEKTRLLDDVQEQLNIAMKAQKLLALFDRIKHQEVSGYLNLILGRLRIGMKSLRKEEDPAGEYCSKYDGGEYLLKTWRIAQEPDILGLVMKNIPAHFEDYNALVEYIHNTAIGLLENRYYKLLRMEKRSTTISVYLMKTSEVFIKAAAQETEPEMKRNLVTIAGKCEELAFVIYNGANLRGGFVPFLKIISMVDDLWGSIRDVDWRMKLIPGGGSMSTAEELNELCDFFETILAPYIPWAAKLDEAEVVKRLDEIEKEGELTSLRMTGKEFKDRKKVDVERAEVTDKGIPDTPRELLTLIRARHREELESTQEADLSLDEELEMVDAESITTPRKSQEAALSSLAGQIERLLAQKDKGQTDREGEGEASLSPGEDGESREVSRELEKVITKIRKTEEATRADLTPPKDEREEMLEAIRMVFSFDFLVKAQEQELEGLEQKEKKAQQARRQVNTRLSVIGVVLLAAIIILFSCLAQSKKVENYYAEGESAEPAISESAISREETVMNYPIVITGKLSWAGSLKPRKTRSGKYYLPQFNLTCYFPDIKYQREFYDNNFEMEKDGNFKLEFNLGGFKRKESPDKVKITIKGPGYREVETGLIKLRGKPPTAYVPKIDMKISN